MSDQGQPIDPSRMIGSRRAMTQSHRRRGKTHTSQRGNQIHHDVTDGGYDQQHIPEQQHIPDQDDIAAAAAPTVLRLEPPFPEGPENISLLHS